LRWPWLLAFALSLTCARTTPSLVARAEPSLGPTPARRTRSLPPPVARGVVAPVEPAAPSVEPRSGEAPCPPGPLQHFFTALSELRSGARQTQVRVLWLGDSHTNADFLSGTVRSLLAENFGDGGPGFVRIGTKFARHEGVKLAREGSWNVDPDPPARRSPQDDGVFGLGGTRAVPGPGASFKLVVEAPSGEAEADARFELSYSLPPHASFNVELGDERRTIDAKSASATGASGIAHLTLSAPLGAALSIRAGRGAPRLYGVNIERAARVGVVLDTSGIDGARLETPLAWNERALVEEVARRSPELFVVAYGTNEAFDALRVDKYAGQLTELVRRLRRGAPRASCLVLGPTDAALGEGSVPRVGEINQVLQAAALRLGCSFASLQQLMGGEGSFARGMRAKERLAQPDHLHLTPKGYKELGRSLGGLLLDAYSAGRADLP
jgi:lysophospholipase L1-like esterase